MSELDLKFNYLRSDGYPHNSILLWNDLYFLAAIFGASKEISKLKEKEDGRKDFSLFSVFREFEYSEISRRLLSAAIICRNKIQTEGNEMQNNRKIGILKYEKLKNKELNLNQACNKIIHASNINFDLTNNSNIKSGYLRPIIYLYGKEFSKKDKMDLEWKATLKIFPFIKAVFDII